MKRLLVAAILAALCVASPAVVVAATQGDFALALAQILGFEVTGFAQAASELTRAEIAPLGGWQVAQPLTTEVLEQVQRALGLAVAEGNIKEVLAEGAVEAAAAAVGVPYSPSTPPGGGTPSIPSRPPIGGPPDGGQGPDGSPFRP